jgi:fatty acid desaturase
MLLAFFENENLRTLLLLGGIVMLAAGLILFLQHRQHWLKFKDDDDEAVRKFEWRKYRRRVAVAVLTALAGFSMAAIYWSIDAKVVASLLSIIFGSLCGILALAIIDLMSVSLQMYVEDDEDARQELVREYHRLKKKADESRAADLPEN